MPEAERAGAVEGDPADLQTLKSLAQLHYVLAALTALLSCTLIIQLLQGLAIMRGDTPLPAGVDLPPEPLGMMIAVLAGGGMAIGWVHAGVIFVMGRWIAARRRHALLLVVSGLNCMYLPLGTALSIWSLIVLSRPRIGRLFGRE